MKQGAEAGGEKMFLNDEKKVEESGEEKERERERGDRWKEKDVEGGEAGEEERRREKQMGE